MRAVISVIFGLILAAFLSNIVLAKTIVVPEGNRNLRQPKIPGASKRRTSTTKSSFDKKYEKIRDLIKSDKNLKRKIIKNAKIYGIDPMHIVGALVGEHTYNVDAYDRLQSYYIKAVSYASGSFSFSHNGEYIDDFIERPEFNICKSLKGSYALWSCREAVWREKFMGKTIAGEKFPKNRFSAVFFQPFYAGQTFGLGQLNPLTAIKLSDLVNKKSRYGKLSHTNAAGVYKAIMDPDITIAYVAASTVTSIKYYRKFANMDISTNPGITATLYNLGNPHLRAKALSKKNKLRKNRGLRAKMPKENYYGWLVNDRLKELRQIFKTN